MRTVTLVNRRKAMLPPLTIPELGLTEHVVGTNERNAKTGAVGRRKVTQRLPQTVTLCAKGTPGDTAGPFPEAVATSPAVLAAKARGDISVNVVEVKPPTAPAPAKPETPKPTAKPRAQE